jgi:predicted DNA-binding protein YlxM (UPF0122 family)
MAVGFGFSVGDIIASLKLIVTAVDALNESGKSSTSFNGLINELKALTSALEIVRDLDIDDNQQVIKVAIQGVIAQCLTTLQDFEKKVAKYQKHLQSNNTVSLEDRWYKIKWAICKKEDVAHLRVEIRGHTLCISMLLQALDVEARNNESVKCEKQQKSFVDMIQTLSFNVMSQLASISSCVTETVQKGNLLLSKSVEIYEAVLRTFSIVRDVQILLRQIPGQVQCQQPLYFVDPFNRHTTIDLTFIRTLDSLLAVLTVEFKVAGCDGQMLDRREFVIEDTGTGMIIDTDEGWEKCFFPGQHIAMNMTVTRSKSASSCPRCCSVDIGYSNHYITW